MSFRITIGILQKAEPPKKVKQEYRHVDLLEKVKEYIKDIEAGDAEAGHQWNYLKTIYKKLCAKPKLTEAEKEILDCVDPIILKYMNHDSEDISELEGGAMLRHRGDY